MELAAQEIRMTGNLEDFHIGGIRRCPRNLQAAPSQERLILAVKFIAVTVALADLGRAIGFRRDRIRVQHTGPCAEAPRSAHLFHAKKLTQLIDNPVLARWIELARI